MKTKKSYYIIIFLIILIACGPSHAGDLELRGQLSSLGLGAYQSNEWTKLIGLRYIPQLTTTEYLADEIFIDTEFSLNAFLNYDIDETNENIKLYRIKIRLATAQSETRLGLQKINFGPAFILRPLRWFDRLDPRDPLGLTEGVYALSFKYSFLNNSQIWIWGLYGNKETKGYDILPSVKTKPEFGGRYQFPVFEGESAFSFHTRTVNASLFEYRESKVSLDGRWDIQVGLWFESVIQKNDSELLPFEWNNMAMLGTDYTFDVGNGLHVIGEHMYSSASKEFLGTDFEVNVSALMINYPYTLMDSFMGMMFFTWDNRQLYKFIQWQRAYDDFLISLNLFHYPESNIPTLNNNNSAPAQGYGFQVTVIYNH